MRRVRYQVACSLDGYIAGPNGEYDWIIMDPERDIWLFGGGELFQNLLALDCVDTVEPAVIPLLLGGGRPLLPPPSIRRSLALTGQHVYKKSGIVLLNYDVVRPTAKRRARRGKA